MRLNKFIIFVVILSLFFIRCRTDYTVFEQIAVEKRVGKKSSEITKLDTVIIDDNVITYISVLNNSLNRKYILDQLTVGNYSLSDQSIPLKFIDSKNFYCSNNTYIIYKYLLDISLSSDEESFKYYSSDFGILLETFQKETTIETISVNGVNEKDLRCLIENIKNDTLF